MAIINTIGKPVEGDNFYGRECEIAHANLLLDNGNSILLAAPRRIGKSSLAKRLIAEKNIKGWKCLYINLEGIKTEKDFLENFINSFRKFNKWNQLCNRAVKNLEKIDKLTLGTLSISWDKEDDLWHLYQALLEALSQEEGDILIVIDELALFLNIICNEDKGLDKVTFILNWLRSLRQQLHQNVRWIFSGSVGLRNFTSTFNLGYTINDLCPFHLDEMTEAEATGLLQGLAASQNLDLSPEMILYVLAKLEWKLPYFIQVMFDLISVGSKGKPITKEVIDVAYERLCSNDYLSTWYQRLKEYRDKEPIARKVLNILSVKPEGLDRKSILEELIGGNGTNKKDEMDFALSDVFGMLENDGFIIRDGMIRRFKTSLLRKYWSENFAL